MELVHHLGQLDDLIRVGVDAEAAQGSGELVDPAGSSLEHPAMVPSRDEPA
jgi:hypothetical protein